MALEREAAALDINTHPKIEWIEDFHALWWDANKYKVSFYDTPNYFITPPVVSPDLNFQWIFNMMDKNGVKEFFVLFLKTTRNTNAEWDIPPRDSRWVKYTKDA